MALDTSSLPKMNLEENDPLTNNLVKIDYLNLQESSFILCCKSTHRRYFQSDANAYQGKLDAGMPYDIVNTNQLDAWVLSNAEKVFRVF